MNTLTIILLILTLIGSALFLYVLLDKKHLKPKQHT